MYNNSNYFNNFNPYSTTGNTTNENELKSLSIMLPESISLPPINILKVERANISQLLEKTFYSENIRKVCQILKVETSDFNLPNQEFCDKLLQIFQERDKKEFSPEEGEYLLDFFINVKTLKLSDKSLSIKQKLLRNYVLNVENSEK